MELRNKQWKVRFHLLETRRVFLSFYQNVLMIG